MLKLSLKYLGSLHWVLLPHLKAPVIGPRGDHLVGKPCPHGVPTHRTSAAVSTSVLFHGKGPPLPASPCGPRLYFLSPLLSVSTRLRAAPRAGSLLPFVGSAEAGLACPAGTPGLPEGQGQPRPGPRPLGTVFSGQHSRGKEVTGRGCKRKQTEGRWRGAVRRALGKGRMDDLSVVEAAWCSHCRTGDTVEAGSEHQHKGHWYRAVHRRHPRDGQVTATQSSGGA